MATDDVYDSDDCGQETLIIEKDMPQEAEPFLCWGRGLPKPKISDIPYYKSLSRFTFQETLIPKIRPLSGRGRGASYKSKLLSELVVDEGIWPVTDAESQEVSSVLLPQSVNADENVSSIQIQQFDNTEQNASTVQLHQLENADENGVISNHRDLSQCLPENIASNCQDDMTRDSARLSHESRNSSINNGSITSIDCSKPSEQKSKTISHNSDENGIISNTHDLSQCAPENIASNCQDNTSRDSVRLSSESRSSSTGNESITSINSSKSSKQNSKTTSHNSDEDDIHEPSQCSPENIASNCHDNTARDSARLSSVSRSSSIGNESITSINSSRSSKKNSKATSHNNEKTFVGKSPFSDSSSGGSDCHVKTAKCNDLNIRGEKALHKKTNVRRNHHLAKMTEKRKNARLDRANTNRAAGIQNLKEHSLSKKNETSKACNYNVPVSVCTSNIKCSLSGSEDSSAESTNEGDNDVHISWAGLNFNKTSNKEPPKQKWGEVDFPSLEDSCSAVSTSKTPRRKETVGLNLKSVADSLLLQPISGSCTESSSEEKDSPPSFLQYLATSDKDSFTITFAMENIPGFLEEQEVRHLLESYGVIVDLKLNPCTSGKSMTAHVTMKSESDLKEFIGHLNDTSPFGASSKNLKVYLL